MTTRPWTPNDYSTKPLLWLDVSDASTLTIVGSTVTAIANKGTAGGSAAIASGTGPTYTATAGINGNKPGLTWPAAGGTNSLNSTALTSITNAAFSVVGIAQANNSTTSTRFIHGTYDGPRFDLYFGYGSGAFGYDFAGSDHNSGQGANSVPQIFRLICNSGGSTAANSGTATPYVNGVAGSTATFTPATLPTIGFGTYAGGTANPLSDYFGEYIALPIVLPTADAQMFDAYVAWKWGRQASLPASNPYSPAAGATSAPTVTTSGDASASGAIASATATAPTATVAASGSVSGAIAGVTASPMAGTASGAAASGPVLVGQRTNQPVGASPTFTTTQAVAAGTPVVIFAASTSSFSGSVNDGLGNTYTVARTVTGSGVSIRSWYCANPVAIPAGTVITLPVGSSSAYTSVQMYAMPGVFTSAPVDVNSTGATNGSGLPPSLTTPTLAQANEVLFGYGGVASGSGAETVGSAFGTNTVTQATTLLVSYEVVSATTPQTFSMTGDSDAFASVASILSFKSAAVAINGSASGAIAGAAASAPTATAGGSAAVSGAIAAVTASPQVAAVQASAAASGACATASASPVSATAQGPASASGGIAAVAASALMATVSGAAMAMGALALATATPPSATAGGGSFASGGIAPVAAGVPAATAGASGTALGAIAGATASAPTATAGSGAIASGVIAGATASPPLATTTGSAGASGTIAAVAASAPTGVATGGSAGFAFGSIAAVQAIAPTASAGASASTNAGLTSVTVVPPSATAGGTAIANGSIPAVQASNLTAIVAGTAGASGAMATVVATPPTATVSTSSSSAASGAIAAVQAAPPAASAMGGSSAFGDIAQCWATPTVGMAGASGVAFGAIASVTATPPGTTPLIIIPTPPSRTVTIYMAGTRVAEITVTGTRAAIV